MEIEQKETDCKCENSTGWTTIKCCNQCGKSVESFWKVIQPKEDMVEYQRIVELTAVGMGKQQEIDQAQLTIKNLQQMINDLQRWSEMEPHHPIGTRLGYGNIPLEPNWEEIAKIEPPLDNSTTNKAWRGAWLEGQMAGYAKCMTTVVDKLQKEVIQPMQSVMIAAAEEIMRVWPAHCDAEGYGPANLMHRLEKGIPAQYEYTAGAFAKLEAEKEKDQKALQWNADELQRVIKLNDKLEAEIKALREAKPTVNEREWALKYRLLILDAKTLAVKTNQLELAAMIRAIEVHVNEVLLPTTKK